MYVDPITLARIDYPFTEEQNLMVQIFDDILVRMLNLNIISRNIIRFLLNPKNLREEKEECQQEIAQKLHEATLAGAITKGTFDPWHCSFMRYPEIRNYINNDSFWEKCPRFIRNKRGMLTSILRKYRALRDKDQNPS